MVSVSKVMKTSVEAVDSMLFILWPHAEVYEKVSAAIPIKQAIAVIRTVDVWIRLSFFFLLPIVFFDSPHPAVTLSIIKLYQTIMPLIYQLTLHYSQNFVCNCGIIFQIAFVIVDLEIYTIVLSIYSI